MQHEVVHFAQRRVPVEVGRDAAAPQLDECPLPHVEPVYAEVPDKGTDRSLDEPRPRRDELLAVHHLSVRVVDELRGDAELAGRVTEPEGERSDRTPMRVAERSRALAVDAAAKGTEPSAEVERVDIEPRAQNPA